MTRSYVINAFFDEEVAVWVGLSDDIPGVAFETKTFSLLDELAQELGRELIEANGHLIDKSQFHDEVEIRIVPMPPED